MSSKQVIVFALLLLVTNTIAQWSCESIIDCLGLEGGACVDKQCVCPVGMQINDQRNGCVDKLRYIGSPCQETSQCQFLITGFTCDDETKTCECRPAYRYLEGRCWPAVGFGEACVIQAQCYDAQMPLAMDCKDGVCACKDDHYSREKGICRKISTKLNDSCILDQDCQVASVPNAVCDLRHQICKEPDVTTTEVPTEEPTTEETTTEETTTEETTTEEPTTEETTTEETTTEITSTTDPSVEATKERRPSFEGIFRSATKRAVLGSKTTVSRLLDGDICGKDEECADLGAAQCSRGQCVCKQGYFPDAKGAKCLAELGMKITEPELCTGFAALLENGACLCPAGYFYHKHLRDCKKAARRLGDACIDDGSCYTFGSSGRCSEPDSVGVRKCFCDPDTSVPNEEKQICELINTGIGDACEDATECPGNAECVEKKCKCTPGNIPNNSGTACLVGELELGENCELHAQCKDSNGNCSEGRCSCKEGHYESNLVCILGIGGACSEAEECTVANSICADSTKKCECKADFVPMDNKVCLSLVMNQTAPCLVDEQCWPAVGDSSTAACDSGTCRCMADSHYRDARCWKKTGLKAVCARSSQCYLADNVDRTECRNSLCQCAIQFREETNPDSCSGALSLTGISSFFLSLLLLAIMHLSL